MEVEVADDLVSHMVSNVDGNDARLPMQELIQYALSIIISDDIRRCDVGCCCVAW